MNRAAGASLGLALIIGLIAAIGPVASWLSGVLRLLGL